MSILLRRLIVHLASLSLVFGCAVTLIAQPTRPSFAEVVPAETGLFVELHDAADLLTPLTEPELWLTLAELAGQPARVEETKAWRQRIQRTVRMSPTDAISTLFAEQVAYVGAGVGRGDDAIVLCRPTTTPRDLVRSWDTRPLPTTGRSSVYRLPYNVGVATQGDRMAFGDARRGGLFADVVGRFDEQTSSSLAEDPTYRKLLARVPPDPAGVFFARLHPPATTQPSRDVSRGPLSRADNVLLALHRDNGMLHFTAVGDAPGTTTRPTTSGDALIPLMRSLPERTLLAWAGQVDYDNLGSLVRRLPERHALRVAFELQSRTGNVQPLIRTLGSGTCLAVGVVTPQNRRITAPPIPAVALLVTTEKPLVALQEWSTLVETNVALYKLLALRLRMDVPAVPRNTRRVCKLPVNELDFSGVLSPDPQDTPIGELHLSWTLDRDVLIIATHTDWLRQILVARREEAPRLDKMLDLTRRRNSKPHQTLFVAQPGPLADLATMWQAYFRKNMPQVLTEAWWRRYQPGGSHVKLGINVTQDHENRRLRIQSVTPSSPADGVLMPEDRILGVYPRRFATSQPVYEITQALQNRPHARWIDLIIEREHLARVYRVPLPFVDPAELGRRLIALGKLVQCVVFRDDVATINGVRGHLALELRDDPTPRFTFELTPPEAPAAAPKQPTASQE